MNFKVVTDPDSWYLTPAPDDREHMRHLCESVIEYAFFDALPPGVDVQPQAHIGPWRVDFLLGDNLVVECDGHAYHASPEELARDKRRDRDLALLGYTVLHFTGREIKDNALRCVGDAIRIMGVRDVE